ncbi:DUF4145 domain-containing protein [Listeria booriae]|uniref:DUF4145 domain-containing protein n=1 Tax=Listeria booriae TaxID=1552123 RepID=UPI001E2F3A66|nr:DUF4145 domain-containing protein [Listeria booriae]MCD2208789.1 DUF4145 domain-containing protein [Listeria booriae]
MEPLFNKAYIANNSGTGDVTRVFVCPHCRGLSAHNWRYALKHKNIVKDIFNLDDFIDCWVISATCQACKLSSIWLKSESDESMIYPSFNHEVPTAKVDMPVEIKKIYNEAGSIVNVSPIASAALSRLAIEKLVKLLEPDGKNLNNRIGLLVNKGLPVKIQQSLDIVRVLGNNAVHPGEIDLSDDKITAMSLLNLINIIVENQISQPKEIDLLYNSLPDGALNQIKNRDKDTHE